MKKTLMVWCGAMVAAVLVALAGLALSGCGPAHREQAATVSRFCFDCHNDAERTGELTLQSLDLSNVAAKADVWEKVVRKLRSGLMPPPGSPIPRQTNPFLETLQAIELNTRNFLGAAVEDPQARAEIADELWTMREAAATLDLDDQPLSVALADTHPGNFIVDRAGIARFVDLEKVHVGSAAIDLAHATLRTSTLWDPRVGKELAPADVVGFYEAYLARRGEAVADALRPWLEPMRRLTWLRTTLFMARWRVQTRQPRNPHDPSQWSDAGLDPATRAHIDARIDYCFSRDAIRAIRSEWL